ncbi:hypothetical protein QUB63_13135 [Microcoleus sp. ARI1-B5]|uniref:hypothetical protein n=1 Tax=unclassified Microcoleus TaxID=2642155 RepID=UPI002FD5FB33
MTVDRRKKEEVKREEGRRKKSSSVIKNVLTGLAVAIQIESVRRCKVKFYLSLVLAPTCKGFTCAHLQFFSKN